MKKAISLILVLLLCVSCGSTRFAFDRKERTIIELGGVYNIETEQSIVKLYEDEGISGVFREVSLGTYTEIDVQGYLGEDVYQYYLAMKEESLEDDKPEPIVFIREESSDGEDCYKSEKELEGVYCLTDSELTKDLWVEIKIIENDLYFELKEDGEDKALSSIKSLSEEYTVGFYARDFKTGYYRLQEECDGILCRNENNVYNTIKIEDANWLLTDVDFEVIDIVNDSGEYLFSLSSESLEDILFDRTRIIEAESLVGEEKYEEAISLLINFEYEDRCSFQHYECNSRIEEYKEALYQKALKCFLVGNYEEAMNLASGRIMPYKDTMRLIKECKKALGISGIGGIISFGKDINGESIDWLILDIDDGKELIISYDILFDEVYNDVEEPVTWETCSLRRYLNDESIDGFMSTYFSAEERDRILEVNNVTNGNEFAGTQGGNDTEDKVFLLSTADVVTFFSHSYECAALKGKSVARWWTRSPGSEQTSVRVLIADTIFWLTDEDASAYSGVRPAMWITID